VLMAGRAGARCTSQAMIRGSQAALLRGSSFRSLPCCQLRTLSQMRSGLLVRDAPGAQL
jgi:hypothetical protein